MSDDFQDPDVSSAKKAFSLVADETRFSILEALWENKNDGPVQFSDLRSEAGIRDSGKFNYHLGKLTDRYVRKTDEGYELRYSGYKIMGALLSGSYSPAESIGPVEMEDDCPVCGNPLEMEYENEEAEIRCSECEITVTNFAVEPGILEGYETEDLPEVIGNWAKQTYSQASSGFCPLCTGKTEFSAEIQDFEEIGQETVFSQYECTRCGESINGMMVIDVLDHPEVVEFHYDHGIDVRKKMHWNLDWLTESDVEVVSEDPIRTKIYVTLEGEELVVEIEADNSVEVLSTERREVK